VVVDTDGARVDELLAWVGGCTLGAEVRERPDGTVEVRMFLDDALDGPRVRDLLEAAGRFGRTRREVVPDGRWVERYQAGLQPVRLSSRFTVLPGGHGGPFPGTIAVHLVPGRAFGTGEHPTTRLCAKLLESSVQPGERWLDLGCGSGILAVVAARLGAGSVIGIDIDPEAIEVARETLAANGLADAVELCACGIEELSAAAFDGIVANVSEALFVQRAGELAGRVRPGGALLASGFLDGDRDEVERALERAGWTVDRRRVELPWAALGARRGPP